MMRYTFKILVLCAAFAQQTAAQDIPATVVMQSLVRQGFEVTSTRYTWLGRILVEATNGQYTRQVLIARGSQQILQDIWQPAHGSGTLHRDMSNSADDADRAARP